MHNSKNESQGQQNSGDFNVELPPSQRSIQAHIPQFRWLWRATSIMPPGHWPGVSVDSELVKGSGWHRSGQSSGVPSLLLIFNGTGQYCNCHFKGILILTICSHWFKTFPWPWWNLNAKLQCAAIFGACVVLKKLVWRSPRRKKARLSFSLSFRLSFPSLNHLYLFLHFYLPGSFPFVSWRSIYFPPFVSRPVDQLGRAVCLLFLAGERVLPFEWFLVLGINVPITGMALPSTEPILSSFTLYNTYC